MIKYAQFQEVKRRMSNAEHRENEHLYHLDYWQTLFLYDAEEILSPILKANLDENDFRDAINNFLSYIGISNVMQVAQAAQQKPLNEETKEE